MPVALAQRLVDRFGQVWNMFGPTETTIWSTVQAVTQAEIDAASSGVVSIGRPIANTVCRVLDARGNLAPIGVAGELLIGGAGLAHGYHDRPELTAERFVADPFADGLRLYRTGDLARWRPDGALEFLGRIDGQVKLRGHRIEVGEIEAAMRSHPAVTAAAVVVDGAGAAARLVGYLTTCPDGVDVGELRTHIGERLPGYMVPAMFVTLDEFPTTPNRKLDRRALPAPGRVLAQPDGAPRDALEARLAGWFATVLERPEVGIYDNFFDLGGYSLLATRLFAIVEQETGRRIPVSALFKAPTVEALAAVIRTGLPESQWTSMVPIQTEGTAVPFFYVAPYMISVLELARLGIELGTDQPLYGFQPQGLDGTSPIHQSIEEMAAHYIVEMKSVQPLGPYRIGGHCAGSWVAFEMARQLEASGDQLDVVLLVDQGPPGVVIDLPTPALYYLKRITFYLRDGRLWPALRWQVQIRMRRRVLRRMAPRTIGLEEAVRAAHYAAHCKYIGGIVHHDLALVLSDESTMLDDKAWYLEWRTKTTGEMRVVQTRGTHANLLKRGYVDDFADCVRWAFGLADTPSATSPPVTGRSAATVDHRGDERCGTVSNGQPVHGSSPAVDVTPLADRGFVVVRGFLAPDQVAVLADDWSTKGTPVASGYVVFPPADEVLASVMPQIEAMSALVREQTPLCPDLNVGGAYFATGGTGGIDFGWHQDHDSWFLVQNHIDYLNFYLPLIKPDPARSNLSVVPYDRLREQHPATYAVAMGTGARRYLSWHGDVVAVDDSNGKVHLVRGGIDDLAETPHLEAGDLLLLRGDMIHRTQDASTTRVALSVRMAQGTTMIRRADLASGGLVKAAMLGQRRQVVRMYLQAFDDAGADELSLADLIARTAAMPPLAPVGRRAFVTALLTEKRQAGQLAHLAIDVPRYAGVKIVEAVHKRAAASN